MRATLVFHGSIILSYILYCLFLVAGCKWCVLYLGLRFKWWISCEPRCSTAPILCKCLSAKRRKHRDENIPFLYISLCSIAGWKWQALSDCQQFNHWIFCEPSCWGAPTPCKHLSAKGRKKWKWKHSIFLFYCFLLQVENGKPRQIASNATDESPANQANDRSCIIASISTDESSANQANDESCILACNSTDDSHERRDVQHLQSPVSISLR